MADITSTGQAPWYVVAGDNDRYRDLAAGMLLLDVLRKAAAETGKAAKTKAAKPKAAPRGKIPLMTPTVISALDLTKSLDPDSYREELRHYQHALTHITTSKSFRQRGLVIAMEGNDAAGKGGAILRIREALDPRAFRVHGVSAPTDEERAHPYLWRFWRRIPMRGQAAIFDRTWYGRVLVERVEGFAKPAEWRRAYEEINSFERCLVADGALVVKLYLHITKEEQLLRFKRRQADPYKHWKINEEDWRNRRKWSQHNAAAEDMFRKTSTRSAPWQVVPANYKWYARVRVAKALVDAVGRQLKSVQ
jgi:polyphosphate kinase 2 (PPK2 family)